MDAARALHPHLDNLGNLQALRRQILDILIDTLDRHQHFLDAWQKTHIANAIGSLAMNVDSLKQPTNAWLRLCLIDLEKARATPDDRSNLFAENLEASDQITYELLLEALDAVGRKIG